MKNNKNYYILQLDLAVDVSTDKEIDSDKSLKKAQDYVRFCVKFINEFSTKKFKDWSKEAEDNPEMVSARERGMADLIKNTGIKYEQVRSSHFIGVPKKEKKLIKFIKDNKPVWAKEKKKRTVK